MERGDSQILMQIVALLVSFAGIAQRASGRSWPVRCLMLAILRRAAAAEATNPRNWPTFRCASACLH